MRETLCNWQQQPADAPLVLQVQLALMRLMQALPATHTVCSSVAAASKRPASHAPPPAAPVDPAKKSRVRTLHGSRLLHHNHLHLIHLHLIHLHLIHLPLCAQVDALFADLLADDPPLRPRPAAGIITAAFASGAAAAHVVKPSAPPASITSTSITSTAAHALSASALRPAALPSVMTGAGHKEVTVTTTKDFAGQIVNVTRTVAVGSDEHKKLMQVAHKRPFPLLARRRRLFVQAFQPLAAEAQGHRSGVSAGPDGQSEEGRPPNSSFRNAFPSYSCASRRRLWRKARAIG